MRYINHLSDFQVIINITDKDGNIIAPPSVPWEAVFADENGCEFTCSYDGTNYTHCIVDFSDIVCFIDNPGFSCGKLRCTFHQRVPSAEYCDGVMDLSQPLQCDIMLSKRESDDSTPITIEASPNWVRGEQGIQGIQGEKGSDGFSPIVSLTKQGTISTLSITDAQGEHTTEIADGAKGDDGFSPIVSLNKVDKVTTLTITDAQGTHTATVNDGESVEVVQSTGTSTTAVMSQKAVSYELNRHTDKFTEIEHKVDGIEILKEDSTGKTVNIEPTYYNGYINSESNSIIKTGNNYISKVYKVDGRVKYTISCSVKISNAILANIGFASTLPVNNGNSTDATVLLYNEKHDVSMEYTPQIDGYILILYSVNSAIYTDSMNVSYISTGDLSFIDFKSKIGDITTLNTEDKSSLVNAINEVNDNSGSTTDMIFDNPLNKNQQTINQETINDIKDIKSTINGNNPYGTRSITAPGSSGYSNVFFDSPIPSGYTITAIDGNMVGYFIQPDGSYVEVILLSNIQLPYKLPSECGGIKVTGNGETIVTFSNNTEEKKGLPEQIDDINKEVSILKKVPLIHVPSTIYAVVNDTIQLFYRSIVECDDIDNYYIRIDGEGSSYPRYHEVKPTSVGNKPMNVQVFDQNGNIIASREFTLNVVSQPKNPLSKTNIAFFGDSLTEGGQYPVEVKRMLTSNDVASGIMPQGKALDNIELVGAMQKYSANYYGIGGWGWNNYALNTDSGVRFYTQNIISVVEGTRYTINGVTIQATTKRTTDQSFSAKLVSGNRVDIPSSGIFDGTNISYTSVADDTSNPLWDGSKVSFAYYFNQCGMTGDVGVISFLLGWNIVYMEFAQYTSMIRTLVTTAHQEYPNARFALVGIQCPSNNGGLANNYPNDRFFSNKQTVIKKMHEYNEYLMDIAQDYPYVDYVDVASQFDSENNMPEVQKNVNLRNEKKEYQGTNGVHPSVNGYYQIADVLYRYIVAKLCQ